jgi:CRISPR-associated protein Csd1
VLLTQLYNFSERPDIKAKLPPEMYGNVKVRWLIQINLEGQLIGNHFLDLGADADKKMLPDWVRASGIKPKLLADNGEYVLGLGRQGVATDKVAERHQQFKVLINACADETQEPSVEAVASFLNHWNPEHDGQQMPDGWDSADIMTFDVTMSDGLCIKPAYSTENLTKIQEFWARYTANQESPLLTCLVTGEERLVEARLPVKIKRIPNGQTAGTSLVSANAAPFTSYGLTNSLTSPISRTAGEGFGKALNYLLENKDSRFYVNSTVYVFWTREAVRYRIGQGFTRDQPGKIRAVFESVLHGWRKNLLRANKFYAVGLTASGGRAVVRDWIEVTLDQAIANLIAWWNAQEVVNEFGGYGDKQFFGIKTLAESLYREPSKDAIDRISADLLHFSLTGGTLSLEILAQAVRRNRAECRVTHSRIALIKLVLSTQPRYKETMATMQCLKTDSDFKDPNDDAAYHCGRLLAQLERIQETALGRNVNTTLIDRYYGAASTSPGKVFGGLIKDAQAHLAKLRKSEQQRGAYEALQQKLEEILCNIPANSQNWPNNLTMQQQSIFSLGYYHQRAQNRKDAMDAKARKEKKADS